MRISDWSSDVCSSDLDHAQLRHADRLAGLARTAAGGTHDAVVAVADAEGSQYALLDEELAHFLCQFAAFRVFLDALGALVVAVDRHRELLQALKRRFVVALEVGFGTGLVLALRIQEHDLAAQLALVLRSEERRVGK